MALVTDPIDTECVCFAVVGRDYVCSDSGKPLSFNDLKILKEADSEADFFEEKTAGICGLSLSSKEALPNGYMVEPIRSYFAENDVDSCFHLARVKALSDWRKSWRYCHCCGGMLTDSETLTARFCPSCNKNFFPRIEPCIIVLVNRGDKVLLARHVQRNQDVYSCLAGFMEAGETAEQTVYREVYEETGIRVKNITYRGSQSWPFPDQLMLGFTAEYESGEVRKQEDEIADADWFDCKACPATPTPGSIAYRLIYKLY